MRRLEVRRDGTSAGVKRAHTKIVARVNWRLAGVAVLLALLELCPGAMTTKVEGQAPAAAAAAPVTPSAAAQTTSPATTGTTPGTTPGTTAAGQAAEGTRGAMDAGRSQESRQRQGLADAPGSGTPVQTEFQSLVQVTTGQSLPIFGMSLFSSVPSTFAPVDDVPVTPDYVIGPGDQIRLQMWGQVNQQGSYVVDRTGSIALPQLGPVHVAGVRFSDLTSFLRAQLGRVYRNFDLNVNLGQLRSIQVFVVGQARRPGSYTIGSLSTLLNALFASGGPTPQGSLRDIQVRRGGEVVTHFDMYDLLLRGDKTKDVGLLPGDVIFIPTVGPQAALVGSVNTPAIYELHGETRISQLLDLGGGLTSLATGSSVRLERIFEHRIRTILDVDLAKSGGTVLENGDVVLVTAITDRFQDAVTLRGNVANPGRYVWHAGMRVSDLIPDKESLVTRNYWRKRNELGHLVLGNAANGQPPEGSLQIQSGGGSTSGTGASAPRSGNSPPQRGTASEAGGGSVGVALTGSNGIFAPENDVILSAPDIDWSYAVIERLSAVDLTTSLLPFNLGKLVLEGDQSQNLELLPGDVVTIFSTADVRVPTSQQTRFVRLEGEFQASGVYSVRPGETLRALLMRAGGFTPQAYLYASEFTRESTRRVERQRLNEYADQLEARVSAATTGAAGTAVSDLDTSSAGVSADQARAAIRRLRAREPIGRIVLDLKPDSRGVESIPDLALEDGDRFVVPRVPSNVNVQGQVYSANAFVFRPHRRVKDYLHQAGGPDREADRKREFVLRADGSVLSRQYGSFDRAQMFPGDTLVVPPVLNRRSLLRTVVDVATLVGQFGFAIAAINLLR